MLNKGVITGTMNGLIYVWSGELGREVVLDRRVVPPNQRVPSVGAWIVFSLKDDYLVDEYTEIPDLLPTKVDDRGTTMIKTRISFPPNDIYRCDLLAHSKDFGIIGIFRNFPNLNENCEFDAWVERVPSALSNLERLYKASWCISEQSPEPVTKPPVEQFSAVHIWPRGSPLSSTVIAFNENGSGFHGLSSGSRGSVSSNNVAETGETHDRGHFQDSAPASAVVRKSYFAEKVHFFQQGRRYFDPQPCISTETAAEEEDITEGMEVAIGLVTSTCNRVGFVWSSAIGVGIIPPGIGGGIQHGRWIKFIPWFNSNRFMHAHGGADKIRYTAKDCCVIEPLYPTYAFKTTVSVQLKLFVPYNYRFNSSNLWTEFFGSVHDSFGRVAEIGMDNILGRCVLVRIMRMKDDYGSGSKWVVHKVVRILEDEESLPTTESPSFAADALRYMMEEPQIRDAIRRADSLLAEQLKEPHLLPEEVMQGRN